MRIATFIIFTLFLSSCGQKQVSSNELVSNMQEIDKKKIVDNYNLLASGFERNDFGPYYSLLDANVLVINEKGLEVFGKEAVIKHFDHQMEHVDFQLLDLNTDELIVSGDLALGKSIYKARIYNETNIDMRVAVNYHLVWKKDSTGDWKIIREVYNPV